METIPIGQPFEKPCERVVARQQSPRPTDSRPAVSFQPTSSLTDSVVHSSVTELMGIIGSRVQRSEDHRFLTRGGMYTADHHFDDELCVTYVRSSEPHAAISTIDARGALTVPGVLEVIIARDLDLGVVPLDLPVIETPVTRPFLADGVARYVGEPIAAIVSETAEAGADALDLVVVDYDSLPVLVDPDEALRGEVILHSILGSNVVAEVPCPPVDLNGCDVVVRQRMVNQRMMAAPLETQASSCYWTADGRLEMFTTSQGPHPLKATLAMVYDLDPSMVRVVSPDVGGAFGVKAFLSPESLVLPWISRRFGRPVRWVETRSESSISWGHGRDQIHDIVIGGTRDGRMIAYDLTILQDVGAYPRVGCFIPVLTSHMHPGPYAFERTACRFKSVLTNKPSILAFRGAGRPEATAALERAIDLFAAEIEMSPTEVRRLNAIAPDAFPYTTTGGAEYDSGQYVASLDAALQAAGYEALLAEQAQRRQAGDTCQLGIGVSLYVEVTAWGGGTEFGEIEICADGSATVKTGTFSHGQGHETGWKMIVADRTGIALDQIQVLYGDTDVVPEGELTGGSRSVQIGGAQVLRAADKVVEQARNIAARLLEASIEDITLDTTVGAFHVLGTPSIAVTWPQIAQEVERTGAELIAAGDFTATSGTYPSGAHVAVVEVDTETGKTTVVRFIAVDDAGIILNPLLAEGQVHGGLAQGIAQALLEEVRYTDDGIPLTTNFADYALISAAELPSFETVHFETPSPVNELGAKGIGESGSIGATPAVINAVVDALAPYGIRHIDMPATPERVWAAIHMATASGR
jgi:carbon-monoxide dehydrogenase large subunit